MWWLISVLILLCIASLIDIKEQIIPVWIIIFLLTISLVYLIYGKEFSWIGILLSAVPGAFFGGMSIITDGKVGMGDSLVIFAIGIGIGIEKCMVVIAVALLLNGFFAIGLMLFKKATRNTKIPFIPFLTLGVGVMASICGY